MDLSYSTRTGVLKLVGARDPLDGRTFSKDPLIFITVILIQMYYQKDNNEMKANISKM